MREDYQEPLPLDLPADDKPTASYDLAGMSADEIVGLHRDIHQKDLLNGTGLDDDLGEAFSIGFARLCTTDPSAATEVLARFSLSENTDELTTYVWHLADLAIGNSAAAIAFFEDIFSSQEDTLTGDASESLTRAHEAGALSLTQVAYLLGTHRTKSLRQARWQ